MKTRVILPSPIVIGEGIFQARDLSVKQARLWIMRAPFENFVGHQTVKVLGLEPATERKICDGYDEALAISAKGRLDFGREYTVEEIEEIGIDLKLIRRTG